MDKKHHLSQLLVTVSITFPKPIFKVVAERKWQQGIFNLPEINQET